MNSFEWIDATSVEQAAALLAEDGADRPVVAKAGGIDLLDLMKEGIVRPARVVNLKSIGGLDGIRFEAEQRPDAGRAGRRWRSIESAPDIRRWYPALAAAAGHAATPQVRNAATIGGNLLQRPRCWYFRSQLFHRRGDDRRRSASETARTSTTPSSTTASRRWCTPRRRRRRSSPTARWCS